MIVWDLGGVVAAFEPAARLEALAEATGLPPDHIDRSIWRSGLDAAAEVGAIPAEEVWGRVLAALDHRIDREQLRRCWARAFTPDPEVLAVVDRIGGPAILFTDNGTILEAALEHELEPIAGHFQRVVLSWQLGVTKGDEQAFRRAATAIGISGADLTLVDDRRPNVEAARSAGWTAIHFESLSDLDALVPEQN